MYQIPKRRKRILGQKILKLGTNPCGEILLQPKQFCNLSEVVARAEDTEETLRKKIRIAAILGTYQSTLTKFPYLSKEWKRNCEKERLLGVSITGQWDCPAVRDEAVLSGLRDRAIEVNKEYAKRFGISPSTSVTCVKPSGTVSQTVDAASGLHPRHAQYYIRRVRISATDALFHMMKDQKMPYFPEVGQSISSASTFVFEFPVKAPEGAVLKDDLSAIDQLEYWRKVKVSYTEHNPRNDLDRRERMDRGGELALRALGHDRRAVVPPARESRIPARAVQEITKERYQEMAANLPAIDFSQILLYEKTDSTDVKKELACVSGVCEVDDVHTDASVVESTIAKR